MRFTCPDSLSPFGAGGLNPYAYCAGDPVNHADPTGHHSFWGWLGIAAGVALGVLLTPVSGGSSLAVALSVVSVTTAVASTGLAVAQQFVEESDPKTAAALGWAALGTGIVSGLSSGVLSKVAPEAKSLVSLLKGTSNRPFGGLMMTPSHAGEGAGAAEISRDITLPFRNENGLIEERATRTLFRFDTRAPGVIRKDGFGPSRDFSYIPDMLNTAAETEKTLIVSETEEGVKAYSNLMGDRGYIYKINVTNARGVSLAKNFQENKDALLDFMRNRRYPGVRDLDYRETRIGELLEESLDYKEYHLSTDDVFKGSIEVLG